MSNLPTNSGSGLPARRVSSEELEAVIRRATELQFARGDAEEGLPEAEVMRIGRELGLDAAHVRRAIAEVRGQPREEKGVMVSVMGPDTIRAARTIRRPAAPLGLSLEEYLVKCEYMVVQRRFPDRTRYQRGSGVGASLGRAAIKMSQRATLLDLRQVDVHVSPLDEDSAVVEVSVPMASMRTGLAAGGVLGGAGIGSTAGAFLAIAGHEPLFALAGAPVFGAALLAARGIYRGVSGNVQERLEAFLDRVEHGELARPPQRPDWRRQLGI